MNLVNFRGTFLVSPFLLGFALSCTPPPPPWDGSLDSDISVPTDNGPCTNDGSATSPVVELGTGQFDWEPYGSCAPVTELIYGAQGGFHVWGRVRIHGISPDIDLSFRAIRLRDGREMHSPTVVRRWNENGAPRGLTDRGNGIFQTEPELVILSLDCARNLVGELLQIDAMVRERGSGREHFVRSIVRVIDEIPSPPQCVALPDSGALGSDVLSDATESRD